MELKGSVTEQNLNEAFAHESKVFTRYLIFAEQARREGREEAAELFEKTARNEKEHAKVWLGRLDQISSAKENITASASGENYESTQMYPGFASKAREEGFEDIARLFDEVAGIEHTHMDRFNAQGAKM